MLDWSPVVSPATILAIMAAGVGFGGWLMALGGKNADLKQQAVKVEAVQTRLDALRKQREDEREADRKEVDMFRASMNAGMVMCQTNLSEHKEMAARTYSTKHEVTSLEERMNKGMDRIVDRLEQISGRLENIGDMIVKSLADRRAG